MERLSQLVTAKEREVAELERESAAVARRLDVAQIELRTLRLALSVVAESEPAMAAAASQPENTVKLNVHPPVRQGNGPKKLWSLSEPYRKLAEAIVARGNPLMYSFEIADLASTVGLDLQPKQASGRFRKYVISGMAERRGDQYRLTASAVRVFEQSAAKAA